MPAYRVSGIGRNGPEPRSVYVRAHDPDAAKCCGKFWLRVMFGRRYRAVLVNEDHPERDPGLRRWIKGVEE